MITTRKGLCPLLLGLITGCAGTGSETGNPVVEGSGGIVGVLPACDQQDLGDVGEVIDGLGFSAKDVTDLIGSRTSPLTWSSSPLETASGTIVLVPQGRTDLQWTVESAGRGRVFRAGGEAAACIDHVDVDVTLHLNTADGGFAGTTLPAILSSEDGRAATLSAYFGLAEVTGSFSVQLPPDTAVQLMTLEVEVAPSVDEGRLWAFVEASGPTAVDAEEITFVTW